MCEQLRGFIPSTKTCFRPASGIRLSHCGLTFGSAEKFDCRQLRGGVEAYWRDWDHPTRNRIRLGWALALRRTESVTFAALVRWLDIRGWDLQIIVTALYDDSTGPFLENVDVCGSARQEVVDVDSTSLSEPAASADCLGHTGVEVVLTGCQERRKEENMIGELEVPIDQKLVSKIDSNRGMHETNERSRGSTYRPAAISLPRRKMSTFGRGRFFFSSSVSLRPLFLFF